MTLFNEKAQELSESAFAQKLVGGLKLFVTVTRNQPVQFDLTIPDANATKAFVLTVRFFVQDNEASSLRNMAQIYEDLPISEEIKNSFRAARDKLNSYLDGGSMMV